MMLEHLGEPAAAARLMRGDRSGHRRSRRCTPATSAAPATTAQVTAAVCARLSVA